MTRADPVPWSSRLERLAEPIAHCLAVFTTVVVPIAVVYQLTPFALV